MSVKVLARIQFGLTCAFHYLFPPLSIGLGLILVIMEAMWLKSGNPALKRMTHFWIKIFDIIFGLGVATGIVLEFEFGTNWATYSRYVGDIFGSAQAADQVAICTMHHAKGLEVVERRPYWVPKEMAMLVGHGETDTIEFKQESTLNSSIQTSGPPDMPKWSRTSWRWQIGLTNLPHICSLAFQTIARSPVSNLRIRLILRIGSTKAFTLPFVSNTTKCSMKEKLLGVAELPPSQHRFHQVKKGIPRLKGAGKQISESEIRIRRNVYKTPDDRLILRMAISASSLRRSSST